MSTKQQTTITPIRLGSVYAFLLTGGTAALVDTGNPGSDEKILQMMARLGLHPHDLKLIVLTHGHSDHFGSSAALREKTGAQVAIHARDAGALRTGENPAFAPTNTPGRLFGLFLSKTVRGFAPFEPDIVFSGETPLSPYGIDGTILCTPGHTEGSVSVLLGGGDMLVGDAVMGGMLGKGKPRFPMYAENVQSAKESIARILEISPTRVYTGHGGPFSTTELRARFA